MAVDKIKRVKTRYIRMRLNIMILYLMMAAKVVKIKGLKKMHRLIQAEMNHNRISFSTPFI